METEQVKELLIVRGSIGKSRTYWSQHVENEGLGLASVARGYQETCRGSLHRGKVLRPGVSLATGLCGWETPWHMESWGPKHLEGRRAHQPHTMHLNSPPCAHILHYFTICRMLARAQCLVKILSSARFSPCPADQNSQQASIHPHAYRGDWQSWSGPWLYPEKMVTGWARKERVPSELH